MWKCGNPVDNCGSSALGFPTRAGITPPSSGNSAMARKSVIFRFRRTSDFPIVAMVCVVTESISVQEAAREFGVSDRLVRMWLSDGQLRGERVRGVWQVDAQDVARVKFEREQAGPRPSGPNSLEYAAAIAEIERLAHEVDREKRARMMLAAQVTELTRLLQEMAADQESLLGVPAVGGAWPRARVTREQIYDAVPELLGPASPNPPTGSHLEGLSRAAH